MRPAVNVRPEGTMLVSALSKVVGPRTYIVFQKGPKRHLLLYAGNGESNS